MSVSHTRDLGNGTILHFTTKCKRCGGDRLWVDFQRELQCLDCDPPGKIYHEKVQAQLKKKAAQKLLMETLENEDREAEEASKERKIITIGGYHGRAKRD